MLKEPPQKVLDAFGISETPVLMAGGEGATYKAGGRVLKPTESLEEANWRADLMLSIQEEGFRVPRPVKSKTDQWVFDGWCVYTFLEGKETKNRWSEKIAISRKFHKSLASADKPYFIEKATHPWAVADRMTWGAIPFKFGKQLEPYMNRLIPLLKPINLETQLIHGDMTGNILFHDAFAPAVIDLSPYWHPAAYSEAIIAVDSIVWDGAPETLIEEVGNTPEALQLLLRAVIWRMKTTEEYIAQYKKGDLNNLSAYDRLIDLIFQKLI